MPGIVLHQMKAVYWPVYKSGSTLLKRHFAQILGMGEFPGMLIHSAPFEKTDGTIPDYEDFSFVRNPYVRLYSLWCHKVMDSNYPFDPNVFGGLEGLIVPGMPFIDFSYTVLFQKKRLDPHWTAQVTQMPVECRTFQIELSPLRFLFPQDNHNLKGLWQTAYNDALLGFVRNYYKKDFIRFGYAK